MLKRVAYFTNHFCLGTLPKSEKSGKQLSDTVYIFPRAASSIDI